MVPQMAIEDSTMDEIPSDEEDARGDQDEEEGSVLSDCPDDLIDFPDDDQLAATLAKEVSVLT